MARRPALVNLVRQTGRVDDLVVPELPAAPVTVDLRRAGVLGLAGEEGAVLGATRWLVAQVAVWHSPASARIVLITAGGGAEDWHWLRWLPHSRGDGPGDPLVSAGNDQTTREDRVRELLRLLDSRMGADDRLGVSDRVWTPAVVVVLDGARVLRSLPGVPRLLKEGPDHGIYTIAVDRDSTRLPEEGKAELAFEPDSGVGATLRVQGSPPRTGVLVDQLSPARAERVARHLCPLRDAGGEQDGATLPATARLVDLLGIDLDRPEEVQARWESGGRSTRAAVGVSIDGVFSLDLKRDGPHGLVAGTTGSGKSEFLQTLVASLAVANRPDAIEFVLIDYKGASAFADCAALPHTVGMVTNLDGRETQRALASLDAELRRREMRLREIGAPDVDAAWELDRAGAAAAGLSRLVLVIDEFAELVQELPDFVTGLVRIARVGRSLGVHLILATQRPAGVVTGEIKANTGLRVALRMEDPGDSMEVLEAPDAARISRSVPGRAYARVGGGGTMVAFQAARVSARRRGSRAGLRAPRVLPAPWSRLGYPLPARPASDDDRGTATDLYGLVRCVTEAAKAKGLGGGNPPWLPPLPELIGTDRLSRGGPLIPAPPATLTAGGVAPVAYGLEDRPAEQAQVPASFDVTSGAHLAVIGSARSGRTTLLRTLAAGLAAVNAPADVQLYALDFGNGGLLPLAELPHCGAVVRRAEGDRVERLVARLVVELDRRQEYLARRGFGDIEEQRANVPSAERLPYQVLLVDRWEGMAAGYADDATDVLTTGLARLVREGGAAGMRVVVSGDRVLLTDRLVAQIDDRLVLRLSDREDYRLAGLNPRQVPPEPLPGRAVRAEWGLEVQVAVVDRPGVPTDSSAQAQAEAVRTIAAVARQRHGERPLPRPPLRVEILPSAVTISHLAQLLNDGPYGGPGGGPGGQAGPLWVPLGVGGDEAIVYGVDLKMLGGFVIGGPPRSGRSSALAAMASWIASHGGDVAVVTPRPSPLSEWARRAGLPLLTDGSASTGSKLVQLVEGSSTELTVLVDDADAFSRSDADEALRLYLRQAGPGRIVAVVAGPVDELRSELRGVAGEARRSKAGILLSPTSAFDGDLFGVRLPRVFVDRMPPGRGCLVLDGDCHLVQLAMPDDGRETGTVSSPPG